jgi:hypothetical protein
MARTTGLIDFPGEIADYVSITRTVLGSLASLEFRVRVNFDTIGTQVTMCGWGSTNASFQRNSAHTLFIRVVNTAVASIGAANSPIAIPSLTTGTDIWLRGKVTVATALCEYWYSYDAYPDWISLGSAVGINAGTTPLLTQSGGVFMGTNSTGLAGFPGNLLNFEEYDDGALTVKFDGVLDLAGIAVAATTFPVSTGQIATVGRFGSPATVLVPPQFATASPTANDLLDLRGISQRVTGYRFDLLDNHEFVIGELHPVAIELTPTITFDTARPVCRDMSNFNLIPDEKADVNVLTDRVRPWMILEDGTEYSMGVFVWADESIPHYSYGDAQSATLVDKGLLLDQPLEHGVSISYAGETRALIMDLIAETGLDTAVDSPPLSLATAGAPMSWSAGTTRIQVLSDLCAQIGLHSPYLDRNGVCRVRAIMDPDIEHVTLMYEEGGNIYAASSVATNDLLHAVNRTIVISSDANDQAYVGVYDVPSGLPWSSFARGFVLAEVYNLQGIGSQLQAEAMARALAIGGENAKDVFVEHVTFSSAPDPRHDGYEIISYRDFQWLEESWSLPLSAAGPMVHTMRRSTTSG